MAKGRHRASRRKINWRSKKHRLLNQWYFFQKPKLKKRIKQFLGLS